jgi:hypothetical protein
VTYAYDCVIRCPIARYAVPENSAEAFSCSVLP